MTKERWASSQLSSIRAIWAQVMVAPDERRMVVFSIGTSKGLMASIPTGGQTLPTSTFGLNEAWKKAQKNAKKKNTSEQMNRTIPMRIPLSTLRVCFPWKVASRVTSRHHWTIVARISARPAQISLASYLWA